MRNLGLFGVTLGIAFLSASAPVRAADREACMEAAEHAQSLRRTSKLRAAREELITCARQVCPKVVRGDCTKWLAEVDAILPSVVVRALDPTGHDAANVRVIIDGALATDKLDGSALTVDPGEHAFRYELEGSAPVEEHVVVRQGEQNRLVTVKFGGSQSSAAASAESSSRAPEQPSQREPGVERGSETQQAHGIPALSWILGGTGIVAIGVGSYFWIAGRKEHSDLESSCAPTHSCASSDVDAAKRKLVIGDVAMGVGLAGLGVAIWLAATSKSAKPAQAIGAHIAPGGGALSVRGHF